MMVRVTTSSPPPEPAGASAPILVVGAGPVGLSAALMLARHGAPVRIVDANDGPTDLSKALVMWRRTLEVLDAELPLERFAEGHLALRGAQIELGDRIEEIALDPEAEEERGVPAGLLVPQSDTEHVLLAALERCGVRVERRTRLAGFEASETGVACALEGPGGEARLQVPWLVGADGAHSTVRHTLGIPFPGESVDRAWLLADVDVEAEVPPDTHRIRIVAARQGIVALFPLSARRWRVIADLGPREPADPLGEPRPRTSSGCSTSARSCTGDWGPRTGARSSASTSGRSTATCTAGSCSPATRRTSTAPPGGRA
jgi:2-polyprenyl-6-methoxyphenol hydroxylase-like FAD-dependent oxidoreductase